MYVQFCPISKFSISWCACLPTGFVSVVYILCEQNIKFFLFLLDEEGSSVEEGMCVMNSHVDITAKRRKQ